MTGRAEEILNRISKIERPVMAEVGVWKGKLSAELLREHPGLYLYLVDRWEPPSKEDSYYSSGSEIALSPAQDFDDALNEVIQKTKPYVDRANICKSLSVSAAHSFEEQYFDMVFVDADHSFDGVFSDLLAWYNTVKIGGYIGGHDYAHPKQGEVKEAVNTWMRYADIPAQELVLGKNMTWFIRRKE